MALKLRQFTREFKLQFLQEADSGKSVSQLAREHHVHPTLDLSLVTTACPTTQAQATSNRITLFELAGNLLLTQTSGNERLGTVKED